MTDDYCLNDICCDRGLFTDDKCICDYSFFGDHCELAISEIYIPQYYVFIGLSCAIFLYSLINAWYQLYQKIFDINQSPNEKSKISISILISSPFNIVLTLSIIFSILKLIWLIIDPFQLYRGQTIIIEHIINDITYTILFYIYGYLLIVWYSMYDEISFTITDNKSKQNRKYICNYYKISLKLRLFIILLVQLTVSIFTGLRKEIKYPHFIMACYIYLLINFFIFIVEFVVYGNQLKQCITFQLRLRKSENQQRLNKWKTIKEQLQSDLANKQAEIQGPSGSVSQNDQSDDSVNKSVQKVKISPKSSLMIMTELSLFNNSQARTRKKNVTFCKNNSSFAMYRQESHHNIKVPSSDLAEAIIEQPETSERDQNRLNESCCLKESAKDIEWSCDQNKQAIINVIVQKKLQTVKEVKNRLSVDIEHDNSIQMKQHQKQLDQSNTSDQSSQEIEKMIEICSYQKNLEKHQCEMKSKSLQSDKIIINKISLLISFGVFFLILFGTMSVIALLDKSVYSEPKGTITYLYLQSFLQFLSLLNVLKLFRDFHSQQVKNLIWIQKVGNKRNDLNLNYSFVVPSEYKQSDDMLQKFETRINMITLY